MFDVGTIKGNVSRHLKVFLLCKVILFTPYSYIEIESPIFVGEETKAQSNRETYLRLWLQSVPNCCAALSM